MAYQVLPDYNKPWSIWRPAYHLKDPDDKRDLCHTAPSVFHRANPFLLDGGAAFPPTPRPFLCSGIHGDRAPCRFLRYYSTPFRKWNNTNPHR